MTVNEKWCRHHHLMSPLARYHSMEAELRRRQLRPKHPSIESIVELCALKPIPIPLPNSYSWSTAISIGFASFFCLALEPTMTQQWQSDTHTLARSLAHSMQRKEQNFRVSEKVPSSLSCIDIMDKIAPQSRTLLAVNLTLFERQRCSFPVTETEQTLLLAVHEGHCCRFGWSGRVLYRLGIILAEYHHGDCALHNVKNPRTLLACGTGQLSSSRGSYNNASLPHYHNWQSARERDRESWLRWLRHI